VSINDVMLFGTLVEDVVPRKNRTGQPFATFRVKTYKQVLDRLSGQTKEHTDLHEVQCLEPDSVARLGVHGKAGAWVRIRGEIAYKDNRSMFVRVPVLGGTAVVSAYFGTDITPSHPHKSAGDPGSDAVRQRY
jgi:Single-strand binding protein family